VPVLIGTAMLQTCWANDLLLWTHGFKAAPHNVRVLVDEAISLAWRNAGADLGIRIAAPFAVQVSEHEIVLYEAHVQEFGGPKGTVVGVLDDKLGDCRAARGHYASNLSPSYRSYSRALTESRKRLGRPLIQWPPLFRTLR